MTTSIWAQMSYTPPRGPCAQKLSLLTTCPCHRFMIHPLKAATTFDCDGCGHHASFHRMANEAEEALVRRWGDERGLGVGAGGGGLLRGGVGGSGDVSGGMGGRERVERMEGVMEEGKKAKRRRIEGGPVGSRWEGMVGAWGEGGDEDVVEGEGEVVREGVVRDGVVRDGVVREGEARDGVVREGEARGREDEVVEEVVRGRRVEEEVERLGRGRKRKGK